MGGTEKEKEEGVYPTNKKSFPCPLLTRDHFEGNQISLYPN